MAPDRHRRPLAAALAGNRLAAAYALGVLLAAGAAVAVALDAWAFVAVAVLADAVATAAWAALAAGHREPPAPPHPRPRPRIERRPGHARPAAPAPPSPTGPAPLVVWVPAAGLLVIGLLAPFVAGGDRIGSVPVITWPLVIAGLALGWRSPEPVLRAAHRRPGAVAAALACGSAGLTLLLAGVA